MTTPEALLEVSDADVRRGRRTVLHQVFLAVHPGEVIVLLGPNGAGKTTLLEAMAGLHDPAGAAGKVRRRGRVALVRQEVGLARRSVRANLMLAQSWWGVERGVRDARARQALARLGAEHLLTRSARALSGGEARRVHLARGLALQADVLLLDEPFAGLDPESHDALVGDLAHALADRSGAVVMSLHDRADAWAIASRVVVVMDGQVVADGDPRALLAEPPTAAVARFLGYDGELVVDGHRQLTRAAEVTLTDPAEASLRGTVTSVTRLLDGARVVVATEGGTVASLHPARLPVPTAGQQVGIAVRACARFADSPRS